MDINNILRGVGVTPSKNLNPADSAQAKGNSEMNEEPVSLNKASAEKVTLTNAGSRLQQATQAASKEPEVNAARVHQIRAQLADGSYKVSPERIAARLMAFELALKSR